MVSDDAFPHRGDSLAALKDLCRLSDADAELLVLQRESFAEVAPDVIASFYKHLEAHGSGAEFLSDPALVARLKNLQLDHLLEFFGGPYDVAYAEKRLRVGRRHEQIGLEPQMAIGAYNLLLQLLAEQLPRISGGAISETFLSLAKVLLFDVALTIQAYHSASTQRLRQTNADLEQALRMYRETELNADYHARLAGHEIRSSLNAIANACDEVAEDFADEIPPEARQSIAAAAVRCWKVVEIVDQILSKPESDGLPRWVEVQEILREVRERVPLHLDGKAIQFEAFESPVSVWAEPIGLREIFSNLVSNAIHHHDKPHGHITIDHTESGCDHVFCVTDDGPGIPVEMQLCIFQPFFRGPSGSELTGKGLGLYFVRQIVEQHRGQVWVDSVPGSGSRFCFSLPKKPRAAEDSGDVSGGP